MSWSCKPHSAVKTHENRAICVGKQFNIRHEAVEANRPSEKTVLDKICSFKGGAVVGTSGSLLYAVTDDERGGGENPWGLDGAIYHCGDEGIGDEYFNNDADHAVYIDVLGMWCRCGHGRGDSTSHGTLCSNLLLYSPHVYPLRPELGLGSCNRAFRFLKTCRTLALLS